MALEHINITIKDPDGFVERLREIFGWHIRWQGPAIHGGESIHVGDETSYIAVYKPPLNPSVEDPVRFKPVRINHIAITVENLDETEARLQAKGIVPHSHADYEPGRRFYYDDPSGVEIEVVSYS